MMYTTSKFAIIFLFSQALSYTKNFNKSEIIECKWKQDGKPINGKVSYLNAQLWKVIADTTEKIDLIKLLEKTGDLQSWDLNDETYYDIFVESQNLKLVSEWFSKNNITYKIATTNFQEWIDKENPSVTERHTGHNLSWVMYHRLEDIESFVHYLANTYPSICSMNYIGSSIERRSMLVVKLSNGKPDNKAVWIDGGIHAREWISPATVTYIMKYLVENWKDQATAVKNIDWHFLPVLNPDGYEYSHTHDRLWRKNRRRNGTCTGTDIYTNFNINWSKTSKCPCHDIYGGSKPFSEPESVAVRDYIMIKEKKSNWQLFLSFHSYGQVIFYPGEKEVKNLGYKMAEEMRSIQGVKYKVESDISPGGSDDWAKRIVGMKYAYIIELRDLGQYGFILPAVNIKPSGVEGLAAIRAIANTLNTL